MFKKFLSKIYSIWKKFAHVLGKINSFILLTIFYFLIFGLVAVIKKIIMFFLPKPALDSYWINRDKAGSGNFEQQF